MVPDHQVLVGYAKKALNHQTDEGPGGTQAFDYREGGHRRRKYIKAKEREIELGDKTCHRLAKIAMQQRDQ